MVRLLQNKEEPDPVRYNAACAIGLLRDKKTIEPLVAATRDEAAFVRAAAFSGLGNVGGEEVVVALIASLSEEESSNVVQQAKIAALARTQHPNAIRTLQLLAKAPESSPFPLELVEWALKLARGERVRPYGVVKEHFPE